MNVSQMLSAHRKAWIKDRLPSPALAKLKKCHILIKWLLPNQHRKNTNNKIRSKQKRGNGIIKKVKTFGNFKK